MELTGKNVFITGSTRGIGAAVALAFAKAGANIVLNGRKAIPEEKINEIKAQGVNCIGVSGDISDYEKAGLMVEEAEKQLGSIDILINNAGITNDKLLMRMSAEDFKACLDINLTGTFNGIDVFIYCHDHELYWASRFDCFDRFDAICGYFIV